MELLALNQTNKKKDEKGGFSRKAAAMSKDLLNHVFDEKQEYERVETVEECQELFDKLFRQIENQKEEQTELSQEMHR